LFDVGLKSSMSQDERLIVVDEDFHRAENVKSRKD
jgi:hypothetical protein